MEASAENAKQFITHGCALHNFKTQTEPMLFYRSEEPRADDDSNVTHNVANCRPNYE
jgi:hypothetical protein